MKLYPPDIFSAICTPTTVKRTPFEPFSFLQLPVQKCSTLCWYSRIPTSLTLEPWWLSGLNVRSSIRMFGCFVHIIRTFSENLRLRLLSYSKFNLSPSRSMWFWWAEYNADPTILPWFDAMFGAWTGVQASPLSELSDHMGLLNQQKCVEDQFFRRTSVQYDSVV